ncbi:MAG TPA: hypothetical protein P5551_08165 [Syntrophales bacterium]|nr:hypothetical protein [Syntrophales bacterium]HRT62315.1 hypothetical protein [Syntrophales bacterium]
MFRRFERLRSLRYWTVVAVAVLAMMFSTAPAYSHDPAGVTLKYDLKKQTLTVTVTHAPCDAGHFVKEIEIGKNGRSVGKYLYTQQTGESITYTYPIAAQPGDVLEAKATCSQYGSKTGRIVIREPT